MALDGAWAGMGEAGRELGAFDEHPSGRSRPRVRGRAEAPVGTRHAYRPSRSPRGERYVELFVETEEGLLGQHPEILTLRGGAGWARLELGY